MDVSTPPSLDLACPQAEADKLKVIKKNFYKLCLLCCKYVKPAFKFSAKIMN